MAGSFGDLVRRQRLASGLTQAELAELTGLSIRSIGDLERGVTEEPRISSKRLLEQVLKLPDACPRDQPAEADLSAATQIVPRQLPAAVRDFVGRQAELATLTDLLDGASDADSDSDSVSKAVGVVVISAIGGTAGVGKT